MAASKMATEAPGLSEITNGATAKTAIVTVVVKRPLIMTWTYKSQGREKEGAKLQCILQCEDPAEYCLGVAKMQSQDKGELKKLMETTWNENAVFRLCLLYTSDAADEE